MAVAKRRPKAANQRGAFITANALLKIMGLDTLIMDWSFVFI